MKKQIIFLLMAANLAGCGAVTGAVVSAAGCALSGTNPTVIGACALAGGMAGYFIEKKIRESNAKLSAYRAELNYIVHQQELSYENNSQLIAQIERDQAEIASLENTLREKIAENKDKQKALSEIQSQISHVADDIQTKWRLASYQIEKINRYQSHHGYNEKLARQREQLKSLANQYVSLHNDWQSINNG